MNTKRKQYSYRQVQVINYSNSNSKK